MKELEAIHAFAISLIVLARPAWSFSVWYLLSLSVWYLLWQHIIINRLIIKKWNLHRSRDFRTNQFHVIDVFHLLVQISGDMELGARSVAVT